jgi:transposase
MATVLARPARMREAGSMAPPDPEVPEKAKRRRFTAEYKLRIVREADACTAAGEVGALLRREGLYSSHLVEWRRQRDAGALTALGARRGRRPGDARDREIQRLRRRTGDLERRLEHAERIIEVQGKLSELLGIPLAPTSEDDEGGR